MIKRRPKLYEERNKQLINGSQFAWLNISLNLHEKAGSEMKILTTAKGKKKLPAKNIVLRKAIHQIWKRDKDIPTQAKTENIYYNLIFQEMLKHKQKAILMRKK